MATRVVLHIGPRKTGTTYLQGILWNNSEWLNERGYTLPLSSPRRVTTAVSPVGSRHSHPEETTVLRDRMLRRINGLKRTSIVSSELLGVLSTENLRQLIDEIEAEEIDVVFGVRDLSQTVPAEWQQTVRGGSTETLTEWMHAVRSDRHHRVHFAHDPGRIFGRWRGISDRVNVKAIILPRPGEPGDLLWTRFCTVLGVDPAGVEIPTGRGNSSMSGPATEFLRRLNERSGSRLSLAERRAVRAALDTLPAEPRTVVPAADWAWLRERQDELIAQLENERAHVLGDPASLRLAEYPPSQGAATTESDIADIGVTVARLLTTQSAAQEGS